jgi:hypothetical protein
MFLSVDGRRSCIYSYGTSQGAHSRHFLSLMVGAPGSTAMTPPREPVVDVLQLGGNRSQTSDNASQGGAL